jgi:hypothetical protein
MNVVSIIIPRFSGAGEIEYPGMVFFFTDKLFQNKTPQVVRDINNLFLFKLRKLFFTPQGSAEGNGRDCRVHKKEVVNIVCGSLG